MQATTITLNRDDALQLLECLLDRPNNEEWSARVYVIIMHALVAGRPRPTLVPPLDTD
jgi:hypothetical protein